MAANDSSRHTTDGASDPTAGESSGGHPGMQEAGPQFRQLVEQVSGYAILTLGPQGQLLSWNPAAERTLGYRAEEVYGRHVRLLYPEEEANALRPERELAMARASGSVDLEGVRLARDRHRFWAAVTITCLKDRSGELSGYSVIIRDITERRAAQDALYERLFEETSDAVVVVDNRGVIRRVNQQAEALFAYPRVEMIGRRLEMLMPQRYRRIHQKKRRGYFKDPQVRQMGSGLELYGCTREGAEIPLDIMLTPMETDEGVWSFAVIRDITQQKRNSAQIGDLTRTLRVRVSQLLASNRELESFLYTISHDLRAPLRHIGGFVDLLNKRDVSALDDKSVHYLGVITDAARKMGALIDDLLSFAAVGKRVMRPIWMNMDDMVRGVVQEFAREASGREIVWKVEPLPPVLGDPAMLRQVMVSLIGNAVKFTQLKDPGQVEIGAQVGAGEVVFHVRDNGVGFDHRYVHKLFGLFQRLHAVEEFPGTGVGLANVKRIVVRHGGRVWAEGAVGGGATLWFTLPGPPDPAP